MESNCKNALRAQFVFLQDNVDLYSQLLDHLYASGTITNADQQIISCEKCDEQRIAKLVNLLNVKSNDPWHKFMAALTNTKQTHVVRKLERELLIQDGIARATELYEFKEEHTIRKDDFITDIGSRNFTDDEINRILERIDRGVALHQNTSDDDETIIRNIHRKSVTGMQTTTSNCQDYVNKQMEEWTTDDCICWVRSIKPPVKEIHIEKLRHLELTGIVLEDLEKEDLREDLEGIPKLVGRQILLNRDKFIQNKFKKGQDSISNSPTEAPSSGSMNTEKSEKGNNYGDQDNQVSEQNQDPVLGQSTEVPVPPGTTKSVDKQLPEENQLVVTHFPGEEKHENHELVSGNNVRLENTEHDISTSHVPESIVSSNIQLSLPSGTTYGPDKAECGASYTTCDTQDMLSDISTEWSAWNENVQERRRTYTLNDIIEERDISQCKLLTYISSFVELQINKDTLRTFVSRLIEFIAGCLNERQNGILYFGVSAWDHGDIKKGQVTGTLVEDDVDKYTTFISKGIQKCFMPEQVEVVEKCYKVDFVPVEGHFEGKDRYVVEITVTPENTQCIDETFFVRMPIHNKKGEFGDPLLYSARNDKPLAMSSKQLDEFMKNKQDVYDRRQKEEHDSALTKDMNQELSNKLIRLLCEDEDKIPQGVFHILVLGPTVTIPQKEDLAFIKSINWQAVFDFDPEGKIKACFDIINRRYIRIFNDMSDFTASSRKNIENPERLKQLQEDIRRGKSCPWIFANGYLDTQTYDVGNWVRKIRPYWKDTLQYLKYEMGEPRVKVVFLLMDDDNNIMVEAAEDLFVTFRENGICLSDKFCYIEPWQAELIRRRRITQEEMDEMCIVGMQWKHTNKIILDSVDNSILQSKFCLPSSSGKLCKLSDILRSSWHELEILSMIECDDDNMSPREKAALSHQKEDLFYKGFEVNWWNFKFENHVMKREIFQDVQKQVSNELRSDTDIDQYVSRIVIYHQPGAGGTTLGKHILWNFRKIYRCAIIPNCLDVAETKDQIFSFRSESDPGNLNPVLLLLDNIEDEKVAALMAEVEEKAKHFTRENDSISSPTNPLVCVLLHLVRYVEIPKSRKGVKQHKLTHTLSQKEKEWMHTKYAHLESKFETNKTRVDPKLLISFNIMKNGFNVAYVRKLTEELLAAVLKDEERLLLKYVSAVNAYDMSFRKLPTSAFDTMMLHMPYSPGPRRGKHAKSLRWESKLSPGLRTLINEDPEAAQPLAFIHSIRVSNEILAKEVFRVLKKESRQCTTDVYRELLDRRDIFNVKCAARDELLCIINEILKKRDRDGTGSQKQFSPVIMEMKDHEGVDKCVDVLEKAYNQTQDVFLAQQIARVYIGAENWEFAEKYGALLVEKSPNRSCLWDTYARVYLKHLTTKFGTLALDRRTLSKTELVNIIELARNAIDKFEEEERVCINEVNFHQVENSAGLFGELETIDTLVKFLPYVECFIHEKHDKESVHRFLVGDYTPKSIEYLAEKNEPDDHLKFLKSMKDRVKSCLCKLEDEFAQRKEEAYTDTQLMEFRMITARMKRFAQRLSCVFGDVNYNVEKEISEDEICKNRRRKINRLTGGYSPMCIFKLDDKSTIEEIIELSFQNMQTQCLAEDLLTSVTAKLALSTAFTSEQYSERKLGERALYEDLSDYTIQLYEKRSTLSWGGLEKTVFLEPYLYYVMFNWPRRREDEPKVLPSDIKNALKEWKNAYIRKFPQQKQSRFAYSKRETTQFFLAYGSGLNGYRTYKQLKANNSGNHASRSSRTFWRNPQTIQELQRFKGILTNEGEEVKVEVTYGTGNKDYITIPTSFPVRKQALWNKQVFMVIGFSWKTPKAYDISANDPTLDDDVIAMGESPDQEYQRRIEAEAYRDEIKPKEYRPSANRISALQEKLRRIEELKERRTKGYKPNLQEEAMLRDEEILKANLRREVEKNIRVDY